MAQNGVCGRQDRMPCDWRADDAAVFDGVRMLPQKCRVDTGVRMAGRPIQ